MSAPLKYIYSPQFFERLCPVLDQHIYDFDCREFIFRVFNNDWPDLEIKERARHIATVLHHFLPKDFPLAAQQITTIAQALRYEQPYQQDFPNAFLADYIEIYGQDHPEEALNALGEITKGLGEGPARGNPGNGRKRRPREFMDC